MKNRTRFLLAVSIVLAALLFTAPLVAQPCQTTVSSQVTMDTTFTERIIVDTVVTAHSDTVPNSMIITTDSLFFILHPASAIIFVKDSAVYMLSQCNNTVDTVHYIDTVFKNPGDTTFGVRYDTVLLQPTGIAVISHPGSVKAYPNPFINEITVETGAESEIALTNALGQVCLTKFIEGGITSFPVRVPSGVYFLRLSCKGKITSFKLVAK